MKLIPKVLSLKDVAVRLNLNECHVRRLALTQELRPLSRTKKSLIFRYEDVARYAARLKKKRLANLKKIARAFEELGVYEEQDAEALQAHSERIGVARGKFEGPEPNASVDVHIQALFLGDKQEPPK